MSTDIRHPMVLIADDDPDDQLMIREAFEERCSDCELRFVCNGVELMAYLRRKPDQNQPSRHSPLPDLLLLDLNMPLKDGRQSLLEIRADPALNQLPTVILTTSSNDDDKSFCLAQGANDYIVKPARYIELLNIVASLQAYWNQPDQIPSEHHNND